MWSLVKLKPEIFPLAASRLDLHRTQDLACIKGIALRATYSTAFQCLLKGRTARSDLSKDIVVVHSLNLVDPLANQVLAEEMHTPRD